MKLRTSYSFSGLLKWYSLCLLLFPMALSAQFTLPPASAPACVETQVGLTNFTLDYHRPGVKGRTIFGELIPYGEVWRTGANEATRFRFDREISIKDELVSAGTYALYTIPREDAEWTLILSKDTSLWGARGYDSSNDILRVDLPTKALSERVESMEFRWMNITHASADLVLEWENTRLEIPVTLATHDQVEKLISQSFGAKTTGPDYYRAARYYLDNNLDLEQAKEWMDRRQSLDGDQFGVMRYHAIIEHKLGNYSAANKIMARSLELAEAAPNPHYVRMNTQTLREWNKESVTFLSGTQLLEKTIAYHDPQAQWGVLPVSLKLYESRPGGSYRRSEVMMDEGHEMFTLAQIRGKDEVYRAYNAEGCTFSLNGRTDGFTPEEIRQHRLSCEAGAVYSNYYTYLWGLPMKLRDPGTIIDDKVYRVDFFGQELLEMKVTYTEEVGGDIWYFYFHPETYALSGYRFYHDEAANDGEYILLEGEAQVGNLRIPAKRHWYTHGDRAYLGSDEVLK
jgi:hypothetical protein